MGRPSEGLTDNLGLRVQPEESQMVRDIAGQLGMSANRAVRWAIRYAHQHATSTTEHDQCPRISPCANATRGLRVIAGRQRTPVAEGQTMITHTAPVEEP